MYSWDLKIVEESDEIYMNISSVHEGFVSFALVY